MHHLLAANELFERPSHERLEGRVLPMKRYKGRWNTDARGQAERFAICAQQGAKLRFADAYRVFQHSLEYRLQVAG